MEAKKVASESREKSDFEVHKQSELSYAVILDGEHIEEFTDEVAANEYVIWLDGKLAKSWEAGRRDALEEQWISVETGMPEVGKRVFVSVLGEGFKVRTTGLWTGSQWRLGSIEKAPDEKFIGPIVGTVDHWRELPEIPKAAAIRASSEKGE